MADVILVLNAGSSSIKFSVFDATGGGLELLLRGQIEGLYTAARFGATDRRGASVGAKAWEPGAGLGHGGAIAFLADFLRSHGEGLRLAAVGHRVVHGGMTAARSDRRGALRRLYGCGPERSGRLAH